MRGRGWRDKVLKRHLIFRYDLSPFFIWGFSLSNPIYFNSLPATKSPKNESMKAWVVRSCTPPIFNLMMELSGRPRRDLNEWLNNEHLYINPGRILINLEKIKQYYHGMVECMSFLIRHSLTRGGLALSSWSTHTLAWKTVIASSSGLSFALKVM
jgi:hypothetical protein